MFEEEGQRSLAAFTGLFLLANEGRGVLQRSLGCADPLGDGRDDVGLDPLVDEAGHRFERELHMVPVHVELEWAVVPLELTGLVQDLHGALCGALDLILHEQVPGLIDARAPPVFRVSHLIVGAIDGAECLHLCGGIFENQGIGTGRAVRDAAVLETSSSDRPHERSPTSLGGLEPVLVVDSLHNGARISQIERLRLHRRMTHDGRTFGFGVGFGIQQVFH